MSASDLSGAAARIRRGDLFIGGRLREARLNRGWSQDRLAQALGVSFQSVQRYEKGASVGAGRLVEAARALNVPVLALMRDLVDGDGAPIGEGARAALSPEAAEAARLLDALAEPRLRTHMLAILRGLAATGRI